MRIFELRHTDGEKEWFTGRTNMEALSNYISTTECDLSDLEGSELIEIPKYKWRKYTVVDEDLGTMTFAEWMKISGQSPDIIAGTMYEV